MSSKWEALLDQMKSGGHFKFVPEGRIKVRLVHPSDPEDVAFFREVTNSYGRTRYMVFAWLPELEGDGEPQIHPLILTKTTLRQIIAFLAEDYDFFSPKDGFGLTIKREGSGRTDTTYTVLPSRKPVPLPEEIVWPRETIDQLVEEFERSAATRSASRSAKDSGDDDEDSLVRSSNKRANRSANYSQANDEKRGW